MRCCVEFTLPDVARDSGVRHAVKIHLIEAHRGKPGKLKDATQDCSSDEPTRAPVVFVRFHL